VFLQAIAAKLLSATQPSDPQILAATAEHLPAIAALAGVIWRACYPAIITSEQIEYMLAKMYSLDVLRAEIQTQGIRYDRLLSSRELSGFASYGPTAEPGVIKLHKLYLLPSEHGRGWGSRLLQQVEREARASGARRLTLAVNKRNTRVLAAYRSNGFVIMESVVTVIGKGFVMDDYLMAKEFTSPTPPGPA
jgi:ribosomal protein S18 acetylase RimI-like enzyme